eukprot:357678-Chlamydomonas_euryale.AAC.12
MPLLLFSVTVWGRPGYCSIVACASASSSCPGTSKFPGRTAGRRRQCKTCTDTHSLTVYVSEPGGSRAVERNPLGCCAGRTGVHAWPQPLSHTLVTRVTQMLGVSPLAASNWYNHTRASRPSLPADSLTTRQPNSLPQPRATHPTSPPNAPMHMSRTGFTLGIRSSHTCARTLSGSVLLMAMDNTLGGRGLQ